MIEAITDNWQWYVGRQLLRVRVMIRLFPLLVKACTVWLLEADDFAADGTGYKFLRSHYPRQMSEIDATIDEFLWPVGVD